MKYVKLEDVQKILSDLNGKVTAIQYPALERFESAVEGLAVYDFPSVLPNTSDVNEMGAHSFNITCPDCHGVGRVVSISTGYSAQCNKCKGKGSL